jgi:hypothetical protein
MKYFRDSPGPSFHFHKSLQAIVSNHIYSSSQMVAGDRFLLAAQRGDKHRRPPFRVSFTSPSSVECWQQQNIVCSLFPRCFYLCSFQQLARY